MATSVIPVSVSYGNINSPLNGSTFPDRVSSPFILLHPTDPFFFSAGQLDLFFSLAKKDYLN